MHHAICHQYQTQICFTSQLKFPQYVTHVSFDGLRADRQVVCDPLIG